MIDLRGEFLRIARMFQVGETGPTHPSIRLITAARYTLIEPNPSGDDGVYVISTDGAVACIQFDETGKADRPYVINIDEETADKLRGAETVNDLRVRANLEKLVIRNKGIRVHSVERDDIMWPAEIFEWAGPTAPTHRTDKYIGMFPNWRKFLPSRVQLDAMEKGVPGVISARYLSIIGRMYDDMLEYRDVRFLYEPADEGKFERAYVQFPFRPDMLLVIAPMKPSDFDIVGGIERITSPLWDDEDEDEEL